MPSVRPAVEEQRESDLMMNALDFPSELTAVQDAYWLARREWKRLDDAYRLVVADMLERREAREVSS